MAAPVNDSALFEADNEIERELEQMTTDEIAGRTRLIDTEIKIMKSEVMRLNHEISTQKDKISENNDKVKINKTLPYLVATVIELLDVDPAEDGDNEGANVDLDGQKAGKCAVVKTSTRQTYFLPVIGLVDAEDLKVRRFPTSVALHSIFLGVSII